MTPWKIAETPEVGGLSSRALLDYLDALRALGIRQHSLMVIKNGHLAASIHHAPYTQHTPHICYSLSKPFTSVAAGFAVAEGLLRYDDRVIDVLRDEAPQAPDPRLFAPLGIQKPRWDMSPQGICCGGWGLYLSCEDIARFGVCLLQNGVQDGVQIIPKDWIALAAQTHIRTDSVPRSPEWAQGYGYHLWRCTGNRFRVDGSRGQFCIVAPGQGMVVAATADTDNLVGELDLFNTYLFDEARQVPASRAEQQAYLERISSLS